MKIDKFMLFLEEPNEGSGAGSSPGGAGNESGTPPAGGTTPPAAPAFDYDKFASSLSGSLSESLKPVIQQNQPKQPPTPEQIAQAKKEFGYFEFDEPFMKEYGDVATQKQAMEKFRDGMLQMVLNVTAAQDQARWAERQQQINSQLSPLQQYYQNQAAQNLQKDFSSSYPKLADPKFKEILEMVGSQLEQSKAFTGKTQKDNFDILAKHAAEVIKRFDPQFTLEGSSSNSNQRQSSNGIDSTSSGSGGGGGNAPQVKQGGNLLLQGLGKPR